MGGEGIAIVIALAFVLLSVIPALNRRKAIITRAVLDERFAAQLRILNTHTRRERNSQRYGVNQKHVFDQERGKIYYSERKISDGKASVKALQAQQAKKLLPRETLALPKEARSLHKLPATKKLLATKKLPGRQAPHRETGRKKMPEQEIRKVVELKQLRAVARTRAMAKVRIERRQIRQRVAIAAFAFGVFATIAAAVSAVFALLPFFVPVIAAASCVAGGFYLPQFMQRIRQENKADAKLIAKATRILQENSVPRNALPQNGAAQKTVLKNAATQNEAAQSGAAQNATAHKRNNVKHSVKHNAKKENGKNLEMHRSQIGALAAATAETTGTTGTARSAVQVLSPDTAPSRRAPAAIHTHTPTQKAAQTRKLAKSVPNSATPAALAVAQQPAAAAETRAQTPYFNMSQYLTQPNSVQPKIVKRNVVPYTPAAAVENESTAKVPYRPVRIGQRLAEADFAPANPAPQMTGREELRSDVLRGGSALDALLEQRRA